LRGEAPPLADTRIASDRETYTIRRVGLVPFCGSELTEEQAGMLQETFFSELSRYADFEIVPLTARDLEEIPNSEPFRVGWIQPRTVIGLARRYRLDAVLIGTVTERQVFTPQRFGVQLDMVAAETGVPIWTSTVHADASDERVRSSVQRWYETTRASRKSGESWELCLLSPRRFAQFGAYEIARGL
jgi:hypothetical protein